MQGVPAQTHNAELSILQLAGKLHAKPGGVPETWVVATTRELETARAHIAGRQGGTCKRMPGHQCMPLARVCSIDRGIKEDPARLLGLA